MYFHNNQIQFFFFTFLHFKKILSFLVILSSFIRFKYYYKYFLFIKVNYFQLIIYIYYFLNINDNIIGVMTMLFYAGMLRTSLREFLSFLKPLSKFSFWRLCNWSAVGYSVSAWYFSILCWGWQMIWVSWGMETFHLAWPSYVTHSRGLRRRKKEASPHLCNSSKQKKKRNNTLSSALVLAAPVISANPRRAERKLQPQGQIALRFSVNTLSQPKTPVWKQSCPKDVNDWLCKHTVCPPGRQHSDTKKRQHHSEECVSWKSMRMWIGSTVDLKNICFYPGYFEKNK